MLKGKGFEENGWDADQFGRIAVAVLKTSPVNQEIKIKLQAARLNALSRQKTPREVRIRSLVTTSATTMGSWPNKRSPVWNVLGWAAPMVFLAFALVGIAQWQQDSRINDLAEVDSALLTDEVPPSAYLDNGFINFLKKEVELTTEKENKDSIQ